MTRRAFLIRHGPTHARGMVGWSDIPADLSDSATLDWLDRELPAGAPIVSSDLIRARDTANAIPGTRPRLPDDPGLRELHFGAWELKTRDEIEDIAHFKAFWQNPGALSTPGGESWHGFMTRVSDAMTRIFQQSSAPDIVITAHFGVILGLVAQARGQAPEQVFGQKIDNFSLTELHGTPGNWAPVRVNQLP
ncbi:histidine phosphatase family protein [Rhodalgimonas zhirmunskyi]|uniref:Histidine phosphatase family protein n=1 Tax=Rhodalgimonas zhirmunskyi TaxID=2964767 RepID=A0AAJ1X6E9_9RHOB|nr:histidine phosphatase family protein [Rhodoalgimonas zhirmunskyi]MDQ2094659.1 histidine phosphatase family protein [Rhodoalgimonas zhirmunskyi]